MLPQLASSAQEVERLRRAMGGRVTINTTNESAVVPAWTTPSLLLVETAGGAVTLTLPDPASVGPVPLTIKRLDNTNTLTVQGHAASATIDGAATLVLTAQHDGRTLVADGEVWRILDALPAAPPVLPPPTVVAVVKPANTTRTNTNTFAPDPHLQLALEPNTRYRAEVMLAHYADSASGLQVRFVVPGGAVFRWAYDLDNLNAPAFTVSSITLTGALQNRIANVHGIVEVGGMSGLLVVEWAQNMSSPSVSTLLAGSHIVLTRLS